MHDRIVFTSTFFYRFRANEFPPAGICGCLCGQHSCSGALSPVSAFEWPIRIYYEDTDSGGVVYYANYLRYMERARTEWMRTLGFEQDRLLREEGIVFAVRSASVEFLRPARFNDLLTVMTELKKPGRASLTFTHTIYRQHEATQHCVSGEVKVACVNADSFRPQPIPESLMKEIVDVD